MLIIGKHKINASKIYDALVLNLLDLALSEVPTGGRRSMDYDPEDDREQTDNS